MFLAMIYNSTSYIANITQAAFLRDFMNIQSKHQVSCACVRVHEARNYLWQAHSCPGSSKVLRCLGGGGGDWLAWMFKFLRVTNLGDSSITVDTNSDSNPNLPGLPASPASGEDKQTLRIAASVVRSEIFFLQTTGTQPPQPSSLGWCWAVKSGGHIAGRPTYFVPSIIHVWLAAHPRSNNGWLRSYCPPTWRSPAAASILMTS